MKFNDHSKIRGLHAFLSASKYHWLNYDEDKLREVYANATAAARGTELHEYAEKAIRLGIKQRNTKDTLSMYINDAIGYKMVPEVVLYYSKNCFGTADTLYFRESNSKLRIHDLKTGITPAHMEQLYIYEALFCLEYGFRPSDIDAELRIYQSNEVAVDTPDPQLIFSIMDKIVLFDKIITQMDE